MNEIYFNENGGVDKKTYLSEVKQGITAGTVWSYQDVGHTHSNNEELAQLIGKGKFDNPKGTKLINHILKIANTSSSDLILDFFAGSGTTGDAVMQLNAEDGGSRRYILVQLPEPIDPKKNKTAYDFIQQLNTPSQQGRDGVRLNRDGSPTIFDITKERLIRAAAKTKENIATKIAFKKAAIKAIEEELDLADKEQKINQLEVDMIGLAHQDLGFKIFEAMPIWENYLLETTEFTPQLVLFDETKLTADDLQMLLTTWKTNDGIPLTIELGMIDLGGYIGYYGQGKLYLMDKGFQTDNLIRLLEKIDSDKEFNPNIIVAFGYNFESKNLREIAENVKSYNNKKHIDIDFITRY